MEQEKKDDLKPWGRVISGQAGVSAARLAAALGVSPGLIRRLAQPIGTMKLSGYSPFPVYDPGLAQALADHPEILKGQKRKSQASREKAIQAAARRREALAAHLAADHPHLLPLYRALVKQLWNPGMEPVLREDPLYREYPAMLWKALSPRDNRREEAIEIIVNILWAMTKEHTWKVNEFGDKDIPLSWVIWEERINPETRQGRELYTNLFAAAIRHTFELPGENKYQQRQAALRRLAQIQSLSSPERSSSSTRFSTPPEARRASSSSSRVEGAASGAGGERYPRSLSREKS